VVALEISNFSIEEDEMAQIVTQPKLYDHDFVAWCEATAAVEGAEYR